MKMKPIKSRRGNRRFRDPFTARAKRTLARTARVLVAFVALPSLTYGGWRAYNWAITTPHFALIAINVNGVERLSKEEIIELSGIKEGENIYSFKAKDALVSIRSNPWVEEAAIDRDFPDVVNIDIKERKPVALVSLGGLYVMDSGGVVFKRYAHEDALDLPVVTGLRKEGLEESFKGLDSEVLELVSTLSARKGFNIDSVSEIKVDLVFGLSIFTLDEGVRLDVGKDSFEEKIAAFEKIRRSRGGSLDGVEALDLTNARSVVVRFSAGAVKEGGEANGQKG